MPLDLLGRDEQRSQPVQLAGRARGALVPEVGIGAVAQDEMLGLEAHEPAEGLGQAAGRLDGGHGPHGDVAVDLGETAHRDDAPGRDASEQEDRASGDEEDLGCETHRLNPRGQQEAFQ